MEVQSDAEANKKRSKKRRRISHARYDSCMKQTSPNSHNVGVVVGKTPTAVRHKQFSHLVEIMKVDSSVRAAEMILSSTSEERKALLQRLYCADTSSFNQLSENLLGGESITLIDNKDDKQIDKGKGCRLNDVRSECQDCEEEWISASKREKVDVPSSFPELRREIRSVIGTASQTAQSEKVITTIPSSSSAGVLDIDEFLFG